MTSMLHALAALIAGAQAALTIHRMHKRMRIDRWCGIIVFLTGTFLPIVTLSALAVTTVIGWSNIRLPKPRTGRSRAR